MTTQPCTLPVGDLVAYADGYLTGGRRDLVEAHLATCLHCQARMDAFDEADRLLREDSVAVDDPVGWATIRARLERDAGWRRSTPRLLTAPALLLLFVVTLIAGPASPIEASFPLSGIVRFAEIEIKRLLPKEEQLPVQHVAPSATGVSAPSFQTVAPAALPLGLVRVEHSIPSPDRFEVLYRNGDDLAILVREVPAKSAQVTVEASGKGIAIVDGADVLWLWDPRPDTVSVLFWERNGVFFEASVIESPRGPYGGLKRPDALQIVEALMAAQDAA